MYMLKGLDSVAKFITAMKSLKKPNSHFLICCVFFVSKGNHFDVYIYGISFVDICSSGSSCSKLTTSLVNDSLTFTSSDTQIC